MYNIEYKPQNLSQIFKGFVQVSYCWKIETYLCCIADHVSQIESLWGESEKCSIVLPLAYSPKCSEPRTMHTYEKYSELGNERDFNTFASSAVIKCKLASKWSCEQKKQMCYYCPRIRTLQSPCSKFDFKTVLVWF